jgi:uncharacterized protein YggE
VSSNIKIIPIIKEPMDNTTLFWTVFLLIVLLVVFLNSSEDLSDVTFDLSETGTAKVQNDRMRVRASVSSELNKKPDQSYQQILDTVSRIKKMLDDTDRVKNIRIETSTQAEYDYQKKGGRELKGYRARSDISFEVSVRNKSETLEAGKVQNQLSSMSGDKTEITIDSVDYFVSDSHRSELQGVALRDAILKGKNNARILVATTYPGRDYRVSSVSIRESSRHSQVFAQARSLEASAPPADVVSQGDSTISVTVDMKINIV